MTYQIALPSDQEQRLILQARRYGIDAQDYLKLIIAERLDAMPPPATLPSMPLTHASAEVWLDALTSADEAMPTLAADALNRERLYADHD
jgi:hypothetical protein